MLSTLRQWPRLTGISSIRTHPLLQRWLHDEAPLPFTRFLATAITPHHRTDDALSPVGLARSSGTARRSQNDCHPIFRAKPDLPNEVLGTALRAVRRELPWLKDSIELVKRMQQILQSGKKDRIVLAVTLVREASRDRSCVVAWNVLVDYFAQQGDFASAIKSYNEMKKRAQFPDARTYTLLLRGLARQSWRDPDCVQDALSIYHSMFASTAKVLPNIIHTNAVLHACAQAKDIDALWGVVAKIPEEGPGSADHITYSVILKALKRDVMEGELWQNPVRHVQEGTTAEADNRRAVVVSRARTMWADIAHRWHRGDVEIDDRLISAMGEVLLLSNEPLHWDEVLSLVAQVANSPRQIPPLNSPTGLKDVVESESLSDEPLDALATSQAFEEEKNEQDPFRQQVQLPDQVSPTSKQQRTKSGAHAQLGNCSLAVLLEACLKLDVQLPSRGYAGAARAYWKTIVENGELVPNSDTYHAYLRILRRNRASHTAVSLVLNDMKDMQLESKTFKIAISTCTRDQQNEKQLEEAIRLMEAMLEKLPRPEPSIMETFAEIAHLRRRQDPSATETAIKLLVAARRDANMESYEERQKHRFNLLNIYTTTEHAKEKWILMKCARHIVGLIDSLPEDRQNIYQGAKSQLDRLVNEYEGGSFEGDAKNRLAGRRRTDLPGNERIRGRKPRSRLPDMSQPSESAHFHRSTFSRR